VLPVLGVYAYSRLVRISHSYRLYDDRLEIESGLFSKNIDNLELFRVRDVALRQGILGRIADYGDVYLHSTDATSPALHVRGIDAPRDFYQQLRQVVSDSRAKNRTLIVEEGQPILEG
jgi:uncharacterized membrane protein YdbT with pleckstrin-like domain